jgi:DNA-binding CsgD family transcriptional regulator
MWLVGTGAADRRLIGRSRELRLLEAALAAADRGRPSMVLVVGDAGIGKSTLVESVLGDARSGGALGLLGHCLADGSGGYPFAPFVEIFRTLILDTDPARIPALLGPARAEFGALLPELAGRIGATGGPSLRRGMASSVHLFELILGTVERLTRERLALVVLEDLQWADDSSRDLLGFLVRTVRESRVVVMATTRPEAMARAHPLRPFLAELERVDRVQRIDLAGLDRAEMRELLTGELGRPPAPSYLARIAERSAGNPFYARQLAALSEADAAAALPPRLHDVLIARVAALSERTQHVLRLAAIGGPVVDEDLLATVAELAPADVTAALREAIDPRVLRVVDAGGPPAVRFAHTLLQDAVAGELLPGERARAHAAFALALERRPTMAGSSAAATAQLARHRDGAGRLDRAFAATVDAAAAAHEVRAYADAARLYERAIALTRDLSQRGPSGAADASGVTPVDLSDLFHRAAESAALAGQYARAVELAREALSAARRDGRIERLSMLEERLRWFLWQAGDIDAALASARAAVAAEASDPVSAGRSRSLSHLGGLLMLCGRIVESAPITASALEMALEVGALPEAAIALGVLAWDEALSGAADAGLSRLREALGMAELLGADEGVALGYTHLAAMLEACGRAGEALDTAERGIATLERIGLGGTYGGALRTTAASAAFDLGRWGEAAGLIDEALEAQIAEGDAVWVRMTAARIALGRGEINVARRHAEIARVLADAPTPVRNRLGVLAVGVEVDLASGRIDAARDVLETWLEQPLDPDVSTWPPAEAALCALGVRAEAEAAAIAPGDVSELGRAAAAADRFVARLRSLDDADARVSAWTAFAMAERTRISGPPDAAAWNAAALAFETLPRPYVAAFCHLREAEASAASHSRHAGATLALRAAHRTAAALGAATLERECLLLARRARIDLEPAGSALSDEGDRTRSALGLTPREIEVLRLLAAGRTNREIGDALFITGKTASVHVSNIFAKLDVGSRIEAANLAHRLGLDASDAEPIPAPTGLPPQGH